MRHIPPASPETPHVLSRATRNANANTQAQAHAMSKGGTPMGNVTDAQAGTGRPQTSESSGNGHTPMQQVFPSTSHSVSNSISTPDEAQQVHLRMRAARAKSES
ncbi:hypothetical protein FIBSPDRAFT_868112 [Athelia psychrophila]|uniref:Uncharacterized protein n=1 Tax=Athelia psychrophila TaxID=1759441 RepID=A0A166DDM1_9AGAM|nr:hypothetical protein FIBSPDRAFT_868112 [Fibularhizoctonia sp. CBS 109695]